MMFLPPGCDLELADGADAPAPIARRARSMPSAHSAAASSASWRSCHRRRARVVGVAEERDRALHQPGDRRHRADGQLRRLEHPALLDVQLDEGVNRRRSRAPESPRPRRRRCASASR